MIIIAIIGGIGAMSIRTGRSTGSSIEARTAASMYADAVERYQSEHGRKVPTWGSADWPTPNAGPLKRLSIGTTVVNPYLRKSVPDVLTRRGPTGATWRTSAPGTGAGGALVYVTTGAYAFRIDAYWDGKLLCSAGKVPAGGQAC
ncbi:MAG: hypothetical protein JWM90_2730 [Thermoleophilia bacterium]|nr:hypothetical protein [Thermoleophilia bacterium]